MNLKEDLEAVRNRGEIQKELVEGRKAFFDYHFALLTHIDSKISNFLSIILITESVIVAYGGAIIKWIGVNSSTYILIGCLLVSGACLAIGGVLIIITMKPKDIHFPNFISDFETLEKGLFYEEQLKKIEEAIKKDDELLERNAKKLKYISYLILFSIVLLLISLGLLLFLSWIGMPEHIAEQNLNYTPLK